MTEFLKTLLLLNLQGSVLIVTLLLLKGVIRKSFSGFWQRSLWVMAVVFTILPMWKIIPVDSVEPILIPIDNVLTTEYENLLQNEWIGETEDTEVPKSRINVVSVTKSINFAEILIFVWILGVFAFLILSFGSYFIFLIRMKNESLTVEESEALKKVKDELKIKRNICVRKVKVSQPPLLTGCFIPVVYMPDKELDLKEEEMVYLHELTHFKHKDLSVKWFVCIINAINWFNPFLYFAIKNLNEACEIYCDESVTKNMNDEDKKAYMNTILNLVVRK